MSVAQVVSIAGTLVGSLALAVVYLWRRNQELALKLVACERRCSIEKDRMQARWREEVRDLLRENFEVMKSLEVQHEEKAT